MEVVLTFEQTKGLEDAFGPDKAAPLIDILQGIVQRIDNQKVAVKADLLLELATKADIAHLKADIARLEGKIDTEIAKVGADIATLNGKLDTHVARINGELQSIRLWMKLLVAVGVLGMSLFSPVAVKLLDFLK